MAWKLLDTKPLSAQENMDKDKQLLANLGQDCLLHIYQWKSPSITYGYFIQPENVLQLPECKKQKLDVGRRVTGGGVVFHLWDLAFSVLIPATHRSFSENTLENYALINNVVLSVVKPLMPLGQTLQLTPSDMEAKEKLCHHFCMARPTIYDLVVEKKKIAGAAQRRTKKGLLHQGTISIRAPDFSLLEKTLPPGSGVLEAMRQHSYSLLGQKADQKEFSELQETIKNELWNQLAGQIR